MRPMPNAVIAIFRNDRCSARWACGAKPRLSFAAVTIDIRELHFEPNSDLIHCQKRCHRLFFEYMAS